MKLTSLDKRAFSGKIFFRKEKNIKGLSSFLSAQVSNVEATKQNGDYGDDYQEREDEEVQEGQGRKD
jgi:hypothetical protein